MHPHRYYLVFCPHGGPTRIAEGLAQLHAATGQRHGFSRRSRLDAEEYAAWRDYELERARSSRTTE